MANQISKKTVAIIGPTGMLGSGVYSILKDRYNLVLVYKDQDKLDLLSNKYGLANSSKLAQFDFYDLYKEYLDGFYNNHNSPIFQSLIAQIGNIDAIINCIGIIKPIANKDPGFTMFLNAAVPYLLAEAYGSKLIHITTDCVYSGLEGAPYNEKSPKSPQDLYGVSKMLGEPQECLTLRTSIVGEELSGFMSLLEWTKKQNGKTISGYTNHLWNGVTTKEFGNICSKIIDNRNDFPEKGIYHIFSNVVSKYEMLLAFKEKYHIDCQINPNPNPICNHSLSTIYDWQSKLGVPTFIEMVNKL